MNGDTTMSDDDQYIEAMREMAKILADLRETITKALDEAEAAIGEVEFCNVISDGLASDAAESARAEGETAEPKPSVEFDAVTALADVVVEAVEEALEAESEGIIASVEIGGEEIPITPPKVTEKPLETEPELTPDEKQALVHLDKIRKMAKAHEEPEQATLEEPDYELEEHKKEVEELDEKAKVKEIELRTLTKYKTQKGWYVRAFDEEGYPTDETDDWVCRTLVKWVQGLPASISERNPKDNRDRSYPTKAKRGIYVNNPEMEYIERLASKQGVIVHEKEFER